MARHCVKAITLLLGLGAAACGDSPSPLVPDAPLGLCSTSIGCGTGNWCNPGSSLCEPRGSILQFEADIYPQLRDSCSGAGCHVPGVTDPKDPSGQTTIAVFAGGPNVAFASLTEGGTSCNLTAHRLCVDEPRAGLAIGRLIAHQGATPTQLLMPSGMSDPWLQKLLHWTAAGALRGPILPPADAPPRRFQR